MVAGAAASAPMRASAASGTDGGRQNSRLADGFAVGSAVKLGFKHSS